MREESDEKLTIDVVNLRQADLDKLAKTQLTQAQWKELFSVHVDAQSEAERSNQPAMLGSYEVAGKTVRFLPRFPLQRGLPYRALFNPARIPEHQGTEDAIVFRFTLPRAGNVTGTLVQQVYPTTHQLPENQLKFYIHFSAPMSRGGSYRYIHLLTASGKEVDAPFLELDEELWDPEGKRFTLFFDPGRIKRGLKPREEVGPSLEEGKSYVLVIDKDWQDARGTPLKEAYRKEFAVGPPDDNPPDPKTWRIDIPPAASRKPLLIVFPKPMDHALLERTIKVIDQNGQAVAGSLVITDEEKGWHFTPQQPWTAGKYSLAVDKVLEDLAGNSIGRPFEVDVLHPPERQLKAEIVKLPFEIKQANPN